MHEEVFEIQRDTLGFHVFEMEDKLRVNFGETQANLVNLGIQRMDAEVNMRVLAAFQASIPQGSPYYISANGLSLPALNLALRQAGREPRLQHLDHRPVHHDRPDHRRPHGHRRQHRRVLPRDQRAAP